MRTTITLEPDVEVLLKTAMKERGLSFKEALNFAVRAGLTQPRQKKRFVQQTFAMGAPKNFRWDKIMAISDAIEDEEILRKLSLQK
jgi:hypothetical protein